MKLRTRAGPKGLYMARSGEYTIEPTNPVTRCVQEDNDVCRGCPDVFWGVLRCPTMIWDHYVPDNELWQRCKWCVGPRHLHKWQRGPAASVWQRRWEAGCVWGGAKSGEISFDKRIEEMISTKVLRNAWNRLETPRGTVMDTQDTSEHLRIHRKTPRTSQNTSGHLKNTSEHIREAPAHIVGTLHTSRYRIGRIWI